MGKRKFSALMMRLNADRSPKEFRIFVAGWNETTKGKYLFDDLAAAAVMAEYTKQGIDRMIDLEHKSLQGEDGKVEDPDARGWCKLELRNGELWAVSVTWTPDGEARLREKRQRYISPVFTYNKDNLRILSLYNIAICAIPATHEAPPLVAASKRSDAKLAILSVEVKKMDVLKAICAALGLKEGSTIDEALAAIKAMKEPDEPAKDPEKAKEEEAAADDPTDEKKMTAQLARLGPKTQGVLRAALSARPALEARLAAIEVTQAQTERQALISANTDKIRLCDEKWANDPTTPIAVLKSFIANAVSVPRTPAAPPAATDAEVKLTEEDKQMCLTSGITHEQVLAHKKKRLEKEKAAAAARS